MSEWFRRIVGHIRAEIEIARARRATTCRWCLVHVPLNEGERSEPDLVYCGEACRDADEEQSFRPM